MQKLFRLTVLTALSCGLVLAQTQTRQRGNGGPPDPAAMIANHVARLTTLLDLTTAQAAQATTIFTSAQSTVSGLETTLRSNESSLRTAVNSNATATIDQLATAIGTLQGQVLSARSQSEAAFYAILTPAQLTKAQTMGPGVFGGPGGPGGPGRRGGPPPPPQ